MSYMKGQVEPMALLLSCSVGAVEGAFLKACPVGCCNAKMAASKSPIPALCDREGLQCFSYSALIAWKKDRRGKGRQRRVSGSILLS